MRGCEPKFTQSQNSKLGLLSSPKVFARFKVRSLRSKAKNSTLPCCVGNSRNSAPLATQAAMFKATRDFAVFGRADRSATSPFASKSPITHSVVCVPMASMSVAAVVSCGIACFALFSNAAISTPIATASAASPFSGASFQSTNHTFANPNSSINASDILCICTRPSLSLSYHKSILPLPTISTSSRSLRSVGVAFAP